MNHYEQQLYSVFKTFDVNNEEALDRSAVLELCDSLQLEDRGATLVDTLFERRADRVTFTQFRNGLLTVLGNEPPAAPPTAPTAPTAPAATTPPAPPLHSDDDSSGREVAPKFVFGAKKYGRRSRPQHPSEEAPRHRVASDSRLDGERARQRMRCKRSASAMEHRDGSFLTDDEDPADLDHDRRVDRERALALCRSLRMHGIDRRIVERIFDDSSADEITVGEFFDRLNSSLTTSVAASLDGTAATGAAGDPAADVIPSDVVVEAWERAGVQRPRRLLLELGFLAAALRPADLERVLEEELQALDAADEGGEARALLPRAALAVARLRTERARRLLDVAVAERDKLRADLAEANRRALLLAQDVDENHARIEAELKGSLRALEARHAEVARTAAAQAAAERERAAAARAHLEGELARRADVEGRLRAELNTLREQHEEHQRRCTVLEERALAAEREATRLAAEQLAEGAGGAGGGGAAGDGAAAAAELEARAEALRRDNQLLRDRNDELCAALEAGARRRAPGAPAPPACWQDEVTGLRQECESSLFSIETEVSDRGEVSNRLRDILEDVRAIPSAASSGETCESCSTLWSTIATIQHKISELREGEGARRVEAGVQTEPAADCQSEDLRKELAAARQIHLDEKENLSTIIRELESSLEQMKIEYDRCEEYWSCKLEEERAAHGEELRAGDERLAELAAHVAAYERQFRPSAALPPIDERLALEAQVNDLQDEFAAYRRERDAELADLRARLAAATAPTAAPTPVPAPAPTPAPAVELDGPLRRHAQETAGMGMAMAAGCACGAGGAGGARWRQAAGAREAAALRARAARAERAAQRLLARLAAADLLVKDLYVENCRLAHHAPPAPPAHPAHAAPRLS